MKHTLISVLLIANLVTRAQSNPFFVNLPVGPHAVGFNVVTLTDDSRVTKRRYDYFGAKETGNRHRQVQLHLWYPAQRNSSNVAMTYGDYCAAESFSELNGSKDPALKTRLLNDQRATFDRFFGKLTDAHWTKLANSPLLARKAATSLPQRFPLLIGTLRPLSTSVTNELLASNGYVVAMVTTGELSEATPMIRYIQEVQDMQLAISYLQKRGLIDEEKVGTLGFSGSGLTQVLFAMHDKRVGALADIESAIYGEGIMDYLGKSNFYDAKQLHVPFLHIYGKRLGSSDAHFDEFHKKIYSDRYHLLLNYSRLHHWDVATEGRASTTVLHVRGDKEPSLRASFELANRHLLAFFNSVLKQDKSSQTILDSKATLSQYPDSLWTIRHYPGLKPPPNAQQFIKIINDQGIDSALAVARRFLTVDPAAAFLHQNNLNAQAQLLQSQKKPNETIALMNFATEVYPKEAWLWNNLAGMHEDFGDKLAAIRCSEKVLDVLVDFRGAEMSFNERVRRSAQARLQRLKAQ
ncbi:hypothetical protein IC229_00355 [Spirosoma sp. BT702]|uniref:Alpha/beta hydrolase n=1 Tax=Spirosoma profusum TaxID=2771354 RepID=A0A926XT19_9BACT|nr:hypothetical protein [Spirosoma profusum]MBD2699069.1 hypothetical protein [Spirosoma profusum]